MPIEAPYPHYRPPLRRRNTQAVLSAAGGFSSAIAGLRSARAAAATAAFRDDAINVAQQAVALGVDRQIPGAVDVVRPRRDTGLHGGLTARE
jgi:hypothetical protein